MRARRFRSINDLSQLCPSLQWRRAVSSLASLASPRLLRVNPPVTAAPVSCVLIPLRPCSLTATAVCSLVSTGLFSRGSREVLPRPPVAPPPADQSNWRGRLLDNSSTTSTVMFPGAPGSIVSDGAGGLLIGDIGSHTVRRARRNAGGSYTVTSIAGNGTVGFAGDSGFASAALLYQPFGVAPDGSGGVYVADFQNCAVRRISAAGNISTVVGAGPLIPGRTTNCGNSGVGGPGTDARIGGPRNIVSDGFGGALFRWVLPLVPSYGAA